MTQEEWLTATDPMQMLGHLGNNICNRKVLVVAGAEVGRFAVDESIRDPAGGPSHGVERPPSNGATLGWDLPEGVRLTKKEMMPIQARLKRFQTLPKYDIAIRPTQPRGG